MSNIAEKLKSSPTFAKMVLTNAAAADAWDSKVSIDEIIEKFNNCDDEDSLVEFYALISALADKVAKELENNE